MIEITKNQFVNSREINTIILWGYGGEVWGQTYRMNMDGGLMCYENDEGEWMPEANENIDLYSKRFYIKE
jgi:hypothetical protein